MLSKYCGHLLLLPDDEEMTIDLLLVDLVRYDVDADVVDVEEREFLNHLNSMILHSPHPLAAVAVARMLCHPKLIK